ncbi:MAG: SGNH/GDSL hydrolase family protein [Acidobacteria bacterium]|nr:SGNH/GDSL hydrolase family protein [Acidobacteriota bacterium]
MKRRAFRGAVRGALLITVAACAGAQQNPLLPGREALELYQRAVQWMESTAVAIPELARAGAPVTENARAAVLNLQRASGQPAALTHSLLVNLRAYLALADSVPKPYPFPEEARRQLAELRDAAVRIEAHFHALLEQKDTLLRGADRDNLRRYAEANARAGAPVPGKPRVVFLGDSITDGWRLNEYFPERDFINRGISGQITGEMLGRMRADVIALKPAAMVVLAGTNDIARGVPVSTIRNNLAMIADLAVASQIKPIFASVLPVSDYHKDRNPQYERTPGRPPATILALNAWLADFCRQRGFAYLDYFSKSVDSAGLLQAGLADDGLHPNSAGYRLMAPLVLEAIEKTIVPPPPAPKRRRLPC